MRAYLVVPRDTWGSRSPTFLRARCWSRGMPNQSMRPSRLAQQRTGGDQRLALYFGRHHVRPAPALQRRLENLSITMNNERTPPTLTLSTREREVSGLTVEACET